MSRWRGLRHRGDDVKGMRGYDNVQIVFEAHLDRSQGDLGYDMWFDKFYHGYGRCSAMRCGEFPPPLLKGGGATFGHVWVAKPVLMVTKLAQCAK